MFLFGLRPRFVGFVLFLLFASLFPLAKRKSGWGICGSSFLVWLWFLFLLIQSICRLQGPFVLAICISCLLSCKDRAFSATSATLEEKKRSAFDTFTAKAVVHRGDHPCRDEYDNVYWTFHATWTSLGLKSGVMHRTCRSVTRTYDSVRSKEAVTLTQVFSEPVFLEQHE